MLKERTPPSLRDFICHQAIDGLRIPRHHTFHERLFAYHYDHCNDRLWRVVRPIRELVIAYYLKAPPVMDGAFGF
jgi:hypothetical protein